MRKLANAHSHHRNAMGRIVNTVLDFFEILVGAPPWASREGGRPRRMPQKPSNLTKRFVRWVRSLSLGNVLVDSNSRRSIACGDRRVVMLALLF